MTREIFDTLFYKDNCDVVLRCSADFGLMRGILRYISILRVTSFGFLRRHPADLLHVLKRLLASRAWTGCYSMPRWIWDDFRVNCPDWDGSDSEIDRFCQRIDWPVKRVRLPKYWALRFSERMSEAAVALPTLRQRITRLASAW